MTLIEQSIKNKIVALGKPLKEWNININRGIITGLNEAFIISSDVKDSLVKEDPKSAEIISNELGINLFLLDPIGGNDKNKTYKQLIINNAKTIYEALAN